METLGLRDKKSKLTGQSKIVAKGEPAHDFREGRTWDDLNREFQFLYRKHHRTTGAYAPVAGSYSADLETMIINFLARNGSLNHRVFEDDQLRVKRTATLVHLWNKDALNPKSVMRKDVKAQERNKRVIRDANFEWGQLVWQELKMWVDLGAPVDQEEIDDMCVRRELRAVQRTYIVKMLKTLGLYQKAKREIHDGQEVLSHVPGVPRGLGIVVGAPKKRLYDKSSRGRPVS